MFVKTNSDMSSNVFAGFDSNYLLCPRTCSVRNILESLEKSAVENYLIGERRRNYTGEVASG
jgi:hypothetical protein